MRPPIVVSSLDMERLETLLDSLPAAQAGTRDTLLDELARAELVEPEDMPQDVVTMNSRVRFVLDNAPQEFDLSLAYPKDVDGGGDKLSVLTPVGSALLGLKVGDSIEWTRPDGGRFDVTVREIVYQPERAGDLHR
ncbi:MULTISPECIES: nucleoside diphosphate kinase regulator [unclassified Massilia]|uniref:nucleoside diphosphate kinase regulator n=1 Tax=unclassified Massilia TaxID=2609279 RepID=UPI001786FDFB|nr:MULTISPECIES: nucleoside diphosphate kinase regulator [unclassified Massilia]MBD8530237.1 nucleoside diphosphate kinase regulator [Massilia sp. CFBP 13647]MBD8673014.1 nucleoside diphosphate kinase regulator [Massilia sp. CFBP 13721]